MFGLQNAIRTFFYIFKKRRAVKIFTALPFLRGIFQMPYAKSAILAFLYSLIYIIDFSHESNGLMPNIAATVGATFASP